MHRNHGSSSLIRTLPPPLPPRTWRLAPTPIWDRLRVAVLVRTGRVVDAGTSVTSEATRSPAKCRAKTTFPITKGKRRLMQRGGRRCVACTRDVLGSPASTRNAMGCMSTIPSTSLVATTAVPSSNGTTAGHATWCSAYAVSLTSSASTARRSSVPNARSSIAINARMPPGREWWTANTSATKLPLLRSDTAR